MENNGPRKHVSKLLLQLVGTQEKVRISNKLNHSLNEYISEFKAAHREEKKIYIVNNGLLDSWGNDERNKPNVEEIGSVWPKLRLKAIDVPFRP